MRPSPTVALVVVLGWSAPAALAQPPTSADFVLSQATSGGAGGGSSSASFVADGTLSQESTVGEAVSTSWLLRSGFWTDLSTQRPIDLVLTKEDSEDPLPAGEHLVYTLTVENLGPGAATGVVVTDVLPAGTTLVATSGCAEDPAGVPTCTLGDLAVGAVASYTIEVSIDPAPPSAITNVATVNAVEVDLGGENDVASETTALDDAPPAVVLVDSDETTPDGELTDCETVHGRPVRALRVQFSEPMADPPGDGDPGDVTNLQSWSLVAAGPDAQVDTLGCGPLTGDDQPAALAAVAYDAGTHTATLALPAGARLDGSLYHLFACASGESVLTDLAGNPLEGGGAGGDFVRFFRADPDNLFADGHLDCGLGAWVPVSTDPNEIVHAEDDADGSADSGSAAVESLTASTQFALGQCQPARPETDYDLTARVRMTAGAAGVGVRFSCEFFDAVGCGGTSLDAPSTSEVSVGDTGGQWLLVEGEIMSPDGTASALCRVDLLRDDGGEAFEARLDHLLLTDGILFADGFESGDTSAWSTTTARP